MDDPDNDYINANFVQVRSCKFLALLVLYIIILSAKQRSEQNEYALLYNIYNCDLQ